MMLDMFPKHPAEQIDYDIDFSRWLPAGDTITTAVATVSPAGQLAVASASITGYVVKVWVNGGLDGYTYEVSLRIGTAAGRVKEVCFKIRVRDC